MTKKSADFVVDGMITLKEAKRILDNDALSDKEVEAIVNELQLWVELAFDNWIEERNKVKNLKETKTK